MDMTSGSDHVSVTSDRTTVTILPETTEEPTTTLRHLWTTESSSTVVTTSIATSSVPVSETSTTHGQATTVAHPGVNPAAIVVPIIVVLFIIVVVVVLIIFLIRRRRRLSKARRLPPPPLPGLEEVDRTRGSEVGGPGCEIWLESTPNRENESRLNDYTDPPEVRHIDQVDQQREESTYVLREDLNQTSAVTDTSGILTSGVYTSGRTLEPAKTENVYQNSGFTGRAKDDAQYVNVTRRSEIESVISDDEDDGGENVGTHLPRQTNSGDGVTSPRCQNAFQDTALSGISSKQDFTSPNIGTRTNALVKMTPDNPSGLRKNVCSIFPGSAGHNKNSEAS